ncbi:MAG: efflux RND transporter periplasmic adaptor subunit, partial [Acidobacteriota bacterium]
MRQTLAAALTFALVALPAPHAVLSAQDVGTAPGPETAPWIGVVLPLEAVDVAAQTAGRLEAISVRPGGTVGAGQVIARIDSSTAAADRRIALAELEMAEAELARSAVRSRQETNRHERRSSTADLWSEEEISATEVDARSAEAEEKAAEARVERARAAVEQLDRTLEQLEIRAPFSGRVSLRYLDPGAFVASGSAIVRLVSSEALLVRFAVPPGEVGALELDADVDVTAAGQLLGRARIRRISPEIDLASQRIFAEAFLDPETLRTPPKGGLGVEVR